ATNAAHAAGMIGWPSWAMRTIGLLNRSNKSHPAAPPTTAKEAASESVWDRIGAFRTGVRRSVGQGCSLGTASRSETEHARRRPRAELVLGSALHGHHDPDRQRRDAHAEQRPAGRHRPDVRLFAC